MKIIYCHHAQRKIDKVCSKDDDITLIGEQDAEIVAQLLQSNKEKKNEKITAIYSSQFYRCTKTANIINKYIQVPIIIDKRFDESGSIENETWLDCQNRTYSALVDIIKNYNDDEIIVCVSSGVNIAVFLAISYGIKPNKDMPFFGVPFCSPIIINIEKQKFLENFKQE